MLPGGAQRRCRSARRLSEGRATLGAVERIEASREATLGFERARYERWLESAHGPVDPEDVLNGRAITFDEAVAHALESNDRPSPSRSHSSEGRTSSSPKVDVDDRAHLDDALG
jgi:hypothetical protein